MVAIVMVAALSAVASACNVPVFRFALERWRPDPYRVTVFHRGELSAADAESLAPLEKRIEELSANIQLRTVDVDKLGDDGESAADRQLLAAFDSPKLPLAVVQYPEHLKIPVPVWAGPLRRESLAALLDSPARQQVIERLTEGQTAVWLLLESGDAAKDDAAAVLLTAELKALEETLKLPELTTADEDVLLAATPLKIAFSVVRVSRTDPAEAALAAMLMGSEPDLAELTDPMVFPVFGRGRALLALIGAGISSKNVQEAAEFLTGPCSCQVKEQNPGFDLLLAAIWDDLLPQSGALLAAATTSAERAAASQPATPELVPIPAGGSPLASTSVAAAEGSSSAVTATLDVRPTYKTTTSSRKLFFGAVVVVLVGFIAGLFARVRRAAP